PAERGHVAQVLAIGEHRGRATVEVDLDRVRAERARTARPAPLPAVSLERGAHEGQSDLGALTGPERARAAVRGRVSDLLDAGPELPAGVGAVEEVPRGSRLSCLHPQELVPEGREPEGLLRVLDRGACGIGRGVHGDLRDDDAGVREADLETLGRRV